MRQLSEITCYHVLTLLINSCVCPSQSRACKKRTTHRRFFIHIQSVEQFNGQADKRTPSPSQNHLNMKHYELSFRVKSNLNSNIILKEYHEHVMHCFCQTQSRAMQRVKGIKLWVSSFRSDLFGTMMWVHNMFEKVPLTCPRSLDKIICSLGIALWITFMWVCWWRRRGGVKWYWIIYGCQKTSSNPWTLIPPPQNVLYLGLQTKILSCDLSISLPICLATSCPM